MKAKRGLVLLSVCAVVAFNVIRAEASDPVGIYAIVEKVVFEPNDQAPERIQIWGAFALSDAQHGDGYLAPQRGYLYYSLPSNRVPGQREAALKEWADLKKVAGTGDAIAFGGRYIVTGHVRKSGEQPQTPDVYPIQMGIIQVLKQRDAVSQHRQSIILPGLREALKSK
jgi:hypothetical protein